MINNNNNHGNNTVLPPEDQLIGNSNQSTKLTMVNLAKFSTRFPIMDKRYNIVGVCSIRA